MLVPIFQDPSFQTWMARNNQLREAVAQGSPSVSIQPYSATPSTTTVDRTNSPRAEAPNAVAEGAEGSQTKSSTHKSESPKLSDSEPDQREQRSKLTTEDQREITLLQRVDQKVRAHEQAHLNAAQGLAVSGADFKYQIGPDAMRYAVAGEVTIETSREDEPEETIDKGNKIIRAALAPADPSPQDRSVAAYAQQMIYEAQAELIRESYAQNRKSDDNNERESQIDQVV